MFTGDHCNYIKQYMKYGISIYTSAEVHENILEKYGVMTKCMGRKKPCKIGDFTVIAQSVPHDDTECDMFLIIHEKLRRLIFITDAEYCPYKLEKLNINHALIECNYADEYINREEQKFSHQVQGHMSLETCKRLVNEIYTDSLTSIGLIHLSQNNSDSERFRGEIEEITQGNVNVWIADKGINKELRGENER